MSVALIRPTVVDRRYIFGFGNRSGCPTITRVPANEIETRVKLAIYEMTADTGAVPNSTEVAQETGFNESDVRAAFARLHSKRLLVRDPGDSSCIGWARPFSAFPSSFPLKA